MHTQFPRLYMSDYRRYVAAFARLGSYGLSLEAVRRAEGPRRSDARLPVFR